MRSSVAALGAMTVFLYAQIPVRAQQTTFTQHRINEMAAALETVRRAVLEQPGLRHPGESLSAYLTRLTAPLPGETEIRHHARVEGYLEHLSRAADATASAHTVPSLRDNEAANQDLWRRSSRDLSDLPRRVTRLKQDWQAHPQAVPGELTTTFWLIQDALNALRDARP